MRLTDAEIAILGEFLTKTWKTTDCVLCGANEWTAFGRTILPFPLSRVDRRPAATQAYACMTCGRCGNSILIDLVKAGIDR